MKRSPIARKTWITRGEKPIRKVNPERKATRQRQYRKHLASAEYKHARKEAMQRAGHRCEYREPTPHLTDAITAPRCTEMESLEAHHLRYPKSRPLAASDLLICCRRHHAILEQLHHGYRHPTTPRS